MDQPSFKLYLIKALEATWDDVPHQYCQVHYLSNAITPVHGADEHMKTQIRKRVRAGAGITMRQSQAEAKKKKKGQQAWLDSHESGHQSPRWVGGSQSSGPNSPDWSK